MRKHTRSLVTTELPVSMMAAAVAASVVVAGAANATPSSSTSNSSVAGPPEDAAATPSAISGVPELRMLKLFERQSSCCVFTEQWKWHPHAHAEGVDALVQSFTQFAREIDGGEVVQAHFSPAGGKNDPKFADDRRPSSGPMQFMSTAGAITMVSTRNDEVQAVLFHDRTISEPLAAAFKAFLQRVLQVFGQRFDSELASLRGELQPNAVLSDDQQSAVLHLFSGFKADLDARLIPELDAALPKQ
ncbi:hypothetical protein PybrP1_006231 [[Pythium] brassicae (nom. inval.)]|nr:hypothetical protein PybrP1_006231 [[Pythium] brassicae (nom. inval.)]